MRLTVKKSLKKGLTRPPLARMQFIHETVQKGGFPNCNGLAVQLEVKPKTIQRDIEFMRDQLGLPIAYDSKRYGYYYTETIVSFPLLGIESQPHPYASTHLLNENGSLNHRRAHHQHEVVIHFDRFAANILNRHVWHTTQRLKQLVCGSFELKMKVGNLQQVERWVLSWRHHAKVMQPVELRDTIHNIIRQMAENYQAGLDAK